MNAIFSVILAGALAVPQPGDVVVHGRVRELQDRLFENRIFSDYARDCIWKEARDAFAHPDDDIFQAPIGMWKGEYWGKLMISACRVAAHTHNEALKKFLHEEGLRLVKFQHPDGYLGTYVNPEFVKPTGENPVRGGSKTWNWNLWCRKYTLWGLLACYRLTGDRVLLDAADRAMTHQIAMLKRLGFKLCETGTVTMRGLPPCSILKPLLWLYKETGKAEYLDYAREINGYWADPTTRFPQFEALLATGRPLQDWYPTEIGQWGKAYEMMSCLAGMVEFYRVTGDMRTLNVVKDMWKRIYGDEANLCGSVAYNDQFTGAARHLNGVSEPCDAIHWMRLCHELWLLTADSRYIDAFERTFYNAFMASVRPDGKWGARELRSHGRHHRAPPQSGMKLQHCCVNNLPRGFIDGVETVIARDGDTLLVALYHDYEASLAGDKVAVSGGFPVNGKVTVRVDRAKAGRLRFRVPSWCERLSAVREGGGGPVAAAPGWLEAEAPAGESVWHLDFALRPRIVLSHRQSVASYGGKDASGSRDYRIRRWSGGEEPDLAPLIRKTPAATVEWGPLMLAKSVKVGDGKEEILDPFTVNEGGWTVAAEPIQAKDVWGAWRLDFRKGGETRSTKACDYASAAEWTMDKIEFSIFF
ncbi:MAG: glycoside hydrolase family 127 protein [Kiritimatiellae bacterium]|nr:glycoside hydrolase family 127 protein [Kiritimatiellia bacterium]